MSERTLAREGASMRPNTVLVKLSVARLFKASALLAPGALTLSFFGTFLGEGLAGYNDLS